jgi:hypothetical protein
MSAARGSPSGHAVGGAARERRGAAEEEAAGRRPIWGEARQWAEDRLVERVGAGADVAAD